MTLSEIRLLALSMYASARRVERLPRITEYQPTDTVTIVPEPEGLVLRGQIAIAAWSLTTYTEIF